MKKLIYYIKKEMILLIISIIVSLFVVFLNVLLPFIFGETIELLSIGIITKEFDKIVENKLTYAFIVIIITGILQFILSTINSVVTYKITKRFSNDLFNKIHRLPLSYLDKQKTGQMVSVIVTDVENIGSGILLGLNQLFVGIMTILATVAFMVYLNWIIALVVVVVSPLSLFVARFIANKSSFKFKTEQIEKIVESMRNQVKAND